MLPKAVIVWKKRGQTPLECLHDLKIKHPKWADLPMTYAGRLDPMAEGLMIILIGEECKNKDKYLKLDKTYEFQVLVGFETDTYDLLGLVVATRSNKISGPRGKSLDAEILFERSAQRSQTVSNLPFDFVNALLDHSGNLSFVEVLKAFVGTFTQKYPAFSSKTVAGKQLFQLSKDDELPDKFPEHKVTIHTLSCTSTLILGKEELQRKILERIAVVRGDFRQDQIGKKWNEVFGQSGQKEYMIFTCIADCSSGTYIRQLVADIGAKLGLPMVTYSIKRTKIGDYTVHDIVTK